MGDTREDAPGCAPGRSCCRVPPGESRLVSKREALTDAEWARRMATRERDVDVRETLEAAAAALRDVEVFVKGSGGLANEWKADCARIARRCESDVKMMTEWLGRRANTGPPE